MRSVGFFLVTTVLVAVQLGHVLGQLANTGVVEDGGCICVKYFLCVTNTTRTSAGRRENHIVIRSNECNNMLYVCCDRSDVRSSRFSAVTTPAPTITDAVPTITDAAPTITDATPCGRGNPDGLGFTTGAEDGETNFGEFPWVVAVLRREAQVRGDIVRNAFRCGGSLIHPQVVLTAALCVVKLTPDELMIRAGEWDMQTTNEPFLHQELSVRKVIIHEDYDNTTYFNDIALLILEEPVTKDVHIDVVCLPTQGETFDHTRCFSAGWGWTSIREKKLAAILKKIELPIVPHSTCENALRNSGYKRYYGLHDSFLCAGGENEIGNNKGDAGGPLVCPLVDKPDHFKQVGIVSWHHLIEMNGEMGLLGFFANVAARRHWIDQKMIANNFNTTSYTYSK